MTTDPTAWARFWAKVDATGDCWIWTASLDRYGYGKFWLERTKTRAHRASYRLLVGDIPTELHVDHLCRVRRCVNPDHLELVSKRENTLRGYGFGAVNRRKTACINGHPYDEGNTYLAPNGQRTCRACQRQTVARYTSRKRNAAAEGASK